MGIEVRLLLDSLVSPLGIVYTKNIYDLVQLLYVSYHYFYETYITNPGRPPQTSSLKLRLLFKNAKTVTIIT